MTRKHFTQIARTIRWQYDAAATEDERRGIRRVAEDLASDFAGFNGNFDRQRFLTACGL